MANRTGKRGHPTRQRFRTNDDTKLVLQALAEAVGKQDFQAVIDALAERYDTQPGLTKLALGEALYGTSNPHRAASAVIQEMLDDRDNEPIII